MKRLTYGEEGPATFSGLVKTLRESFAIPQEASLQIQYTDQDGDLVLLSGTRLPLTVNRTYKWSQQDSQTLECFLEAIKCVGLSPGLCCWQPFS
jgi:hypothetical protein